MILADLAATPDAALAVSEWRALPATQAPWQASGVRLAAGQAYTLLATGTVHWSARHPDLYGGPGFHLYARVHPGGRLVNLTRTSDIYRACHAQGAAPRICLEAADDQGIVRKAVDWALTDGTRLAWRWRLDLHPSTLPEDTPCTHDYVSVAAEFDDGRDLTWIWSAALPRDRHFACPIRAWQTRETHWVVRNAGDPRGAWLDEERAVRADVAAAMGAPPLRIVAVWLIAVATFQHQRARAAFEGIELVDGERRLRVL